MFKKVIFTFFLILVAVLSGRLVANDSVVINDLRVWQSPQNIMFIFDTSAKPRYSIEELQDPNRIVLRFKSKQFNGTIDTDNLNNSNVVDVRYGKHKNHLHFVIELTQKTNYRYYELPPFNIYGNRFVLELTNGEVEEQPQVTKPIKQLTYQSLAQKQRDIVVVIDPGHGGEDPGATANNDKVYYIPLEERTQFARKNHADIFISVHADSFFTNEAQGASIYTLSENGATSDAAQYLADRENLSDFIAGVTSNNKEEHIQDTIHDLVRNATLASSVEVGDKILPFIGRHTKLHKKQVEQANFVVLKSVDIPSILVESGFMSNQTEIKKLTSKSFQSTLAQSIVAGVKQYFEQAQLPGTYFYQKKSADKIEIQVKERDTLSQLAQKYNVTISEIKIANNLRSNMIYTGQKLLIPNN